MKINPQHADLQYMKAAMTNERTQLREDANSFTARTPRNVIELFIEKCSRLGYKVRIEEHEISAYMVICDHRNGQLRLIGNNKQFTVSFSNIKSTDFKLEDLRI